MDHPSLEDQLAAVEHDGSYTTVRVLKESEWERTELVADDQGTRYVRKYLHGCEQGFGQQYGALQSIDSPALPRVREIYRIPGSLVVVMQYLEGPTLREWVRDNGPCDDAQARAILLDACVGVRALHACDPPIVHRDINPSNIIVTECGVKLIDFGIARRYRDDAVRDTRLWGTVGYAPPEQFGFGQSDIRTDVYALGMLYWFVLTGTDPEPELSRTIAHDESLPEAARGIIERCVQFEPDRRYPDVGSLCGDLQAGLPALKPETIEAADSAAAAPCASARTQASRKTRTWWARLWPDIAGRPRLTRALNVWRAISTICVLFGFFAAIESGFCSWRAAFPAEASIYAAIAFTMIFCLFVPVWLLTADVGGFLTRSRFLSQHRIRRIALIFAMDFAILIIVSLASQNAFSPDYLAAAAQNGTKF